MANEYIASIYSGDAEPLLFGFSTLEKANEFLDNLPPGYSFEVFTKAELSDFTLEDGVPYLNAALIETTYIVRP